VALNTVKVQNWDNTIVTVPTWRLMSESFKNWRGMSESGGRRIMRTLQIDAGSIRFLCDEEIDRLGQIRLLADYIQEKRSAIHISRAMAASELGPEMGSVPINQRRLTNIGTFRAYVQNYLEAHHFIRQDMWRVVCMMQPTESAVPLQLYCFTNTTALVEYEAIQSDIFDHLLAVLPEFGLHVFQNPSSSGLREALADWHAITAEQARQAVAVAQAEGVARTASASAGKGSAT
jgi:miniconductance mechanosensitive channel